MVRKKTPQLLSKYKLKKKDKKLIEPHEIFLDAESPDAPERGDERSKLELPLDNQIFKKLFYFSAVLFAILLVQIFYLQIIRHDYYSVKSKKNFVRAIQIPSLRGVVYDAGGNQLVFNKPAFDLVASPAELPRDASTLNNLLKEIALIIRRDAEEMKSLIDKSIKSPLPFILLSNIPRDAALILDARSSDFPGFVVQQTAVREYNDGSILSHIIGYLGKLSDSEVKNHPDYSPTEYIGKTGLELNYEGILRGKPGVLEVEIDSLGYPQKEYVVSEPENGRSLVLSLDFELQKEFSSALEKKLSELHLSKAAAVALDPRNGNILAMVSLPSFDSNLFARGISVDDYKKLTENSDRPLFNRAVAGGYPSGSVVKPLLASAALEEKVITPEKTILSTGGISAASRYSRDTVYFFRDWKEGGHGLVNMIKAIAESVNTYFYAIGGGYGDVRGLGPDRIKKYLGLFGWGSVLGVDLPGEKAGLIPDPEWKEELKGERWYIGDSYNLSIGQGDLAVTPLQVAAAIGAIANNGTLYRPRFVTQIGDPKNIAEKIDQKVIRAGFISEKNLDAVRRGMRAAVISGSSRALYDLPVKAAGKTGTAQFGKDKTHAWFSGFAPYENPEIVVAIVIEGGGEGSLTAVPVAKEVLKWYFEKNK